MNRLWVPVVVVRWAGNGEIATVLYLSVYGAVMDLARTDTPPSMPKKKADSVAFLYSAKYPEQIGNVFVRPFHEGEDCGAFKDRLRRFECPW